MQNYILKYKAAVLFFVIVLSLACSQAFADKAVFVSDVVYSGAGAGDYMFKGNGKMSGTAIANDGCVEFVASPGVFEFTAPYKTDDLISGITLNWQFTGKVTMEVSVSDGVPEYFKVINGVPLIIGKSSAGKEIRWRATLGEASKLISVNVSYADISGVTGGFGNPKLSGFQFKKPVFIQGAGDVFNYQVMVKIGESKKAKDCDVYIKGIAAANFADVRFTQADSETSLPYYLSAVTGASPDRTAIFWVKVPQIPKDGITIYLYYGKFGAEDLSSGQDTFDFYYDFKDVSFNDKKWDSYKYNEGITEYKLKADKKIKLLDYKTLDSKEKVLEFFKSGKDFQWVRSRQSAVTAPKVDVKETTALAEQTPNLPSFTGTTIADNGDLVLIGLKGRYTSKFIYPEFKARILVPGFKAASAPAGAELAVDISAKGDGVYKTGCENDSFYYASKQDFSQGNTLSWRANMSRQDLLSDGPALKKFSLDYRPGGITVISPDGGELLKAGSKFKVVWSALDYEPSYKMNLSYNIGGSKEFVLIAKNIKNSGVYFWQVPDIASEEFLLKASDALEPSVYDKSNGYFGVRGSGIGARGAGSSLPAAENAGPVIAGPEKPDEAISKQAQETDNGIKFKYDIVIKLGDNNPKDPAAYKEGDIVAVVLSGHAWSETEKRSFLIVQANLTAKRAAQLMQSKTVVKGRDRHGRDIVETRGRKYRIDLGRQGLLEKKAQLKKGPLAAKPFVDAAVFEEK